MKYYNFNKIISKLEKNNKIEFVQVQSVPNPDYSQIYIVITESSMNKVYLKFKPKETSFNLEIVKIFLGEIFQFRSEIDYTDSDIDYILNNIEKVILDLMINESVGLCIGDGYSDYLEMLSQHIRVIELELARKRQIN